MILLNRKRIFIFLVLLSWKVYPSAQIPDLIIIDNDTLKLHSSPTKGLFRRMSTRIRENNSGSCWRGYQALWELKNDSLYLREIYSCVPIFYYSVNESSLLYLKDSGLPDSVLSEFRKIEGIEFKELETFKKKLKEIAGKKLLKRYGISPARDFNERWSDDKRVLDKAKIVRKKHIKNHYFVSEFTGKLRIPLGKRLMSEVGWLSVYEEYLYLMFTNGILVDKHTVKTLIHDNDSTQKVRVPGFAIDLLIPQGYRPMAAFDQYLGNVHFNLAEKDSTIDSLTFCDSTIGTYISCISWYDRKGSGHGDYTSIPMATVNEVMESLDPSVSYDSLSHFYIGAAATKGIIAAGISVIGTNSKDRKNLGVIVVMNWHFRAVILIRGTLLKAELSDLVQDLVSGLELHYHFDASNEFHNILHLQ
jgi:hypothetical protein